MAGQMRELAADPAAAREYFGQLSLAAFDELLTERDWSGKAFDAIGEALEAATIGAGRDGTSARVMGAVVGVLGNEEDVSGPPAYDLEFHEVDVVPPDMRDSMAVMLADYIGDVQDSLSGLFGNVPPEFDDPAIPGDEPPHAQFDDLAMTRVLADTAKLGSARGGLRDAEMGHLRLLADFHGGSKVSLPVTVRATAVRAVARRAATVFGALGHGYEAGLRGRGDPEGAARAEDAHREHRDLLEDVVFDAIWRYALFSEVDAPPASLHVGGDPANLLIPLPEAVERPDYKMWIEDLGLSAAFPAREVRSDYWSGLRDARQFTPHGEYP